jgi:RNA polymerase primary sigma factor
VLRFNESGAHFREIFNRLDTCFAIIRRKPTLAQLAERMEISAPSALALLDLQQGLYAVSIDTQTGEHEDDTLANSLEADPHQGPEHVALPHTRNEQIRHLLLLLTKAERKVILLRYGILDGEEHTYEEIGRRTHMGERKIHSLEQRALLKMRRVALLKRLQDFVD